MHNKKKILIGVFVGFLAFSALAVFPRQAEANLFTDLWQSLKESFQAEIGELPNQDEGVDMEVSNSEETKKATSQAAATEGLYKPVADYEQAVIGAVERTSPAVVSIIVSKDLPVLGRCANDPFSNLPPEVRQFFDLPDDFYSGQCEQGTRTQKVGGGSGFIVSADGLVLTNKHVVIDEEASYTVLLNDGKKYEARVLARDPFLDLAVLKVGASGLPTVTLGDSDTVKLGQTAIAIGNSLGEFQNTVSAGVISGLSRTITATGNSIGAERIEGVFQTDAAINPGNSGGPLLNLKGEVIAINTAMASGAENVGFAIPINQAKRDIDSVKTSGKITTPYLGVRYVLVNESVAADYGLSVTEGVLLVKSSSGEAAVVKGSPADKVGLKEGDVITSIGGEKITREQSLGFLIQKYEVGDRVDIKFVRDGVEQTVRATLEGRDS